MRILTFFRQWVPALSTRLERTSAYSMPGTMNPLQCQRASRCRSGRAYAEGNDRIRTLPFLSDNLVGGGPYHYNEKRPHGGLNLDCYMR